MPDFPHEILAKALLFQIQKRHDKCLDLNNDTKCVKSG